MTDKIEAVTRKRVAKLVIPLFNKAIRGYQDLLNLNPKDFASDKSYKNYYDCCKAALSHLQLIIKLAEWAATPVESGYSAKGIDRLIQVAQAENDAAKLMFD